MYIKVNQVFNIGNKDHKAILTNKVFPDKCNYCDIKDKFECGLVDYDCCDVNRQDKKNIVFMKIGKNLT